MYFGFFKHLFVAKLFLNCINEIIFIMLIQWKAGMPFSLYLGRLKQSWKFNDRKGEAKTAAGDA